MKQPNRLPRQPASVTAYPDSGHLSLNISKLGDKLVEPCQQILSVTVSSKIETYVLIKSSWLRRTKTTRQDCTASDL